MGLIGDITEGGINIASALLKAARGATIPPGSSITIDAASGGGAQTNKPDAPHSAFLNPMALWSGTGEYRERSQRHSQANAYELLRMSLHAVPIAGVIVQTRAQQLAQFGRPAETRYDMGFKLGLRDPTAKPTPKSKARAAAFTEWCLTCGTRTPNSQLRDNLSSWLRKVGWDTLTFAADATEVVRDRMGRPSQWYAVDASTIRLAARCSPVYSANIDKEVRYVQLQNGIVVTQYRYGDLIYGIRNATTDVRNAGYGVSELEVAQRAMSAMGYAWDFNMRFFKQGTSARGIINLPGYPARMIQEFRANWKQMISGSQNAHTIPTLAADKMEWIDLGRSQKDSEYAEYMSMLIKIVCAAYSMDPSEINFLFSATGQTQALNGNTDNTQKLIESRNRGLRPILQHFEHAINTHLIWPIDDEYKFEFVGLDAMTRKESLAFNTQRVKTTHTIDEIRALDDLPPLPNNNGQIILDNIYLQNKNGGGMGMGQPPGMGGDTPPPDDASENDDDEAVANEDGNQDVDPGDKPTDADEDLAASMAATAAGDRLTRNFGGR